VRPPRGAVLSRWDWSVRAAGVLLAVLSVALMALSVTSAEPGQRRAPATEHSHTQPAVTSGDFTAVPGRVAVGPGTAGAGADPVALTIAAVGVRSTLDRVGLGAGGEIEAPGRWQVPGWYSAGPAPGQQGPAVILGHVDSPQGPAVFARLGELRPGDLIEVSRADASTAVFAVDRSISVPQHGFPTAEVYGPTPDSELRLITCEGPYDRTAGRYLHNLVVFATLTSD
jgi:hypothetical protein